MTYTDTKFYSFQESQIHTCDTPYTVGSEGGTEGEIVYLVFSISVTAFISQCTPSISDVEGLTL